VLVLLIPALEYQLTLTVRLRYINGPYYFQGTVKLLLNSTPVTKRNQHESADNASYAQCKIITKLHATAGDITHPNLDKRRTNSTEPG
jgi:hypothetical protein